MLFGVTSFLLPKWRVIPVDRIYYLQGNCKSKNLCKVMTEYVALLYILLILVFSFLYYCRY